jgi:cytochrome c oxidase subunit 2
MILYIVAHAPADYERWLTAARLPAATPADPFARRGEEIFMTKQCVLCHNITGTDAHGRVGPDLTHVGSRIGLAANTLPNDVASLEAWVTHAQSLKPYAQMPNITAFDGEELRALAAFLQGLR